MGYTDGIILSFDLLLDITIIVIFLLSIDYVEYVIVLAQIMRRDNETRSNAIELRTCLFSSDYFSRKNYENVGWGKQYIFRVSGLEIHDSTSRATNISST